MAVNVLYREATKMIVKLIELEFDHRITPLPEYARKGRFGYYFYTTKKENNFLKETHQ